jgi:hypothetical protein
MLLAFALYVRSVPVKEPKANRNMTSFADLGKTPYDAVPPDTGGGAADTAATAESPSSSEQSSADTGTIEL